MVPELILVLGSQPADDRSHKPGDRLPLISAWPTVTSQSPIEHHRQIVGLLLCDRGSYVNNLFAQDCNRQFGGRDSNS